MNLDRATFDHIVDALQQEAPLYFEGRAVTDVQIVETIPRPYSQLARVLIRFTDGEERAYIKLYRHPRLGDDHNSSSAKREHDAHAMLYEAFKEIEGCGVVRPIASFSELGGWVMEEIAGRTLEQELSRSATRWSGKRARQDLQKTLWQAGAFLRHFQQEFRQEDSISVEACGVLSEIDELLDRSDSMGTANAARVRAHVARLVAAQGNKPLPVVGQHGECYAPHHIFVRGGELLVFDITGIKYGPEYEDLSNLWVSLEALLKYPLFSRSVVGDLQAALLQGFKEGTEIQRAAFEIFQIKNMLRLLDSLRRISVTDWRAGVRRLVGLRFVRRWILKRT
jgi:hypothetical protein